MTDRTDPPLAADEPEMLLAWLNYHRDTLRRQTAGLDAWELARPLPPTTMTLGGLLNHLAVVESSWFSEVMMGEPLMPPFDTAPWDEDRDWEWHEAYQHSPEDLLARYNDSVTRSDRVITEIFATDGLDRESVTLSKSGERFTMRWVMVHLIEEYARHNGHADLLREAIDGQTEE